MARVNRVRLNGLTCLFGLLMTASACQPLDLDVGEGALEMSAEVQAGFKSYLEKQTPINFAVSVDGQSFGYKYCKLSGLCDGAGARWESIKGCESTSDGVPCKIFATGRYVVWKHPGASGWTAESQ